MEPIRYKPGEAIRWLQTGADANKQAARQKGREMLAQSGAPGVKRIGQGVEALIDLGKGAWADVLHTQAEASEYVLQEDRFDILKGNSIKTVPYKEIKKISAKGERTVITLSKGSTVVIKPYAHISAGRLKVPVGWMRNGMEVPYELLVDEISARAGIDVDEG
jgi:hypothetical protein